VSKVPVLLVARAKIPVGVTGVPADVVSVTVTVQLVDDPTVSEGGVQATVVLVVLGVKVTVAVPLLPA
jgi:hypothetical protein